MQWLAREHTKNGKVDWQVVCAAFRNKEIALKSLQTCVYNRITRLRFFDINEEDLEAVRVEAVHSNAKAEGL